MIIMIPCTYISDALKADYLNAASGAKSCHIYLVVSINRPVHLPQNTTIIYGSYPLNPPKAPTVDTKIL